MPRVSKSPKKFIAKQNGVAVTTTSRFQPGRSLVAKEVQTISEKAGRVSPPP